MKNINYKRILGKVLKLEINPKETTLNEKIRLNLEINNHEYAYFYDYVFMACGAIGSYRLFKQSFEDINSSDKNLSSSYFDFFNFYSKKFHTLKNI